MNFLTSFAFTQAIFPEAKTTFDNYTFKFWKVSNFLPQLQRISSLPSLPSRFYITDLKVILLSCNRK